MDVRVRFTKYGPIKYVGHLDLMRYFQKALRRSGLPLSFTKGFSPHPILSFASPLGVGITSEGEYMDFSLDHDIPLSEIHEKLNAEQAYGIEILSVTERMSTKKAMAELAAASYLVYFKKNPFDAETLRSLVEEKITSASSLVVTKKTKKSERQVDLLPLIYEIEVLDSFPSDKRDHYIPDWEQNSFLLSESDPAIYMKVCARSSDNLKPELLMEALLGIPFDSTTLGVHRLDMYAENEAGVLIPLGEAE
jgi:radical SAM-linked protein